MHAPLDEIEESTWKYILETFPLEVLAIMGNLSLLGNCVSVLVGSQPILGQDDFVEQLQKSNDNDRRNGAWTVLIHEAFHRLYTARLLLFTGHQGRCLACIRDAFECLRWADVCLKDVYQADCWLRGKDVTAQRRHIYHELLSEEKNTRIQSVLNPEGTHAYLKACLISLHSIHVQETPLSKAVIQRSIVSLLSVIDTIISYILNTRPELREAVEIDPALVLLLTNGYERNIKSLKEGGYW